MDSSSRRHATDPISQPFVATKIVNKANERKKKSVRMETYVNASECVCVCGRL